jgi:hypothetical protein
MLHNIQGNNIDHLGAALVTVFVALCVLKIFSFPTIPCTLRFVNDVTNTVNVLMWLNKKWASFIMLVSHKFHVAFMIGCKNEFLKTVDEIGLFLTVIR